MIGQKVGHYRITSLVGRGVCGSVYFAHDEVRNQESALKVLYPEVARLPGVSRRLRRVSSVLSGSVHPALVPPLEVLETGGLVSVGTEKVAGKSLGVLMEELGAPLDPQQALPLFEEVVGAVIHVHRAGVICGNIRPANILMCASQTGSQVRLTDVGVYPMGASGQMAPVSDELVLEYLRFCAPEVIGGAPPATVQTDIFALGATLYQMVTGWPPRIALELERLRAASRKVLQAPRALRPDLPRKLERVLLTATAVDPEVRYASAQGFLDALKGLESSSEAGAASEPVGGVVVPVRPTPAPTPVRPTTPAPLRPTTPAPTEGGVQPVVVDGPTVAMDTVKDDAEAERRLPVVREPERFEIPVKKGRRQFDIQPARPSLVRGELQVKPVPAKIESTERVRSVAKGVEPKHEVSEEPQGLPAEKSDDGPAGFESETEVIEPAARRPAGGGLLLKVAGMILVAGVTALLVLWLGGVFSPEPSKTQKKTSGPVTTVDGSTRKVAHRPADGRPTGPRVPVRPASVDSGALGPNGRMGRAPGRVEPVRPAAGRPVRRAGRARVVSVSVKGAGVGRGALRRALARRLGSVAACYRRVLKTRPRAQGVVKLDLVIARNGSVANVLVTGSTLRDDSADRCIRNRIRRLRLKGVKDVTMASVRIALSP